QRVSLSQMIRRATKAWHGVKLGQPDWGEHSHSFALYAGLPREGLTIYVILNAYWEALDFELPPADHDALLASGESSAGHGRRDPGRAVSASPWRRWIDTSLESPQDIVSWRAAPEFTGQAYPAAARSVVVLFRDVEKA